MMYILSLMKLNYLDFLIWIIILLATDVWQLNSWKPYKWVDATVRGLSKFRILKLSAWLFLFD